MYYIETNNVMPETQHQIMDRIIEEERSHFVRLTIKGLKEREKGLNESGFVFVSSYKLEVVSETCFTTNMEKTDMFYLNKNMKLIEKELFK